MSATSVAAKAPANAVKQPKERILSIDRFRGAVVFSMIFFQMLKDFKGLEFWSRIAEHNHEKGIMILPGIIFVFSIKIWTRAQISPPTQNALK